MFFGGLTGIGGMILAGRWIQAKRTATGRVADEMKTLDLLGREVRCCRMMLSGSTSPRVLRGCSLQRRQSALMPKTRPTARIDHHISAWGCSVAPVPERSTWCISREWSGSTMIKLEQREDMRPVCPHCTNELRSMWFQELKGRMGKRYVYFCGTCRKVLGVSHRKGFWMG